MRSTFMNPLRGTLAACCCLWALVVSAQETRPVLPVPPVVDDAPAGSLDEVPDDPVDVLTRGPVHEAFAEQVTEDDSEPLVITAQPPEPVDEVPPEYRPEEEQAVWVPGYWFWDDERSDFIWISGVWRIPPPNRQWVPGYWHEVDGRYQWVAGFWATISADPVPYVEAPPESLELGPQGTAPGDDYFWIPGCWQYESVGYRWRPGYWYPFQADWLWVPAHYRWTPRGSIFVSGYWDYRLPYRGHLFAPIHYRRPIYRHAGYRFRPSIVLRSSGLSLHLFARPSYRHYYFGDYYDSRYARLNYYPFYRRYGRQACVDPIFAYYNVHFRRSGIDYYRRMNDWHRHLANHVADRPPHRYAAQVQVRAGGSRLGADYLFLGVRLNDYARRSDLSRRLQRINDQQVDRYRQQAVATRDFQRNRRDFERDPKFAARGPRSQGARAQGPASGDPAKRGNRGNLDSLRERLEGGDAGPRKGGKTEVARGDRKPEGRPGLNLPDPATVGITPRSVDRARGNSPRASSNRPGFDPRSQATRRSESVLDSARDRARRNPATQSERTSGDRQRQNAPTRGGATARSRSAQPSDTGPAQTGPSDRGPRTTRPESQARDKRPQVRPSPADSSPRRPEKDLKPRQRGSSSPDQPSRATPSREQRPQVRNQSNPDRGVPNARSSSPLIDRVRQESRSARDRGGAPAASNPASRSPSPPQSRPRQTKPDKPPKSTPEPRVNRSRSSPVRSSSPATRPNTRPPASSTPRSNRSGSSTGARSQPTRSQPAVRRPATGSSASSNRPAQRSSAARTAKPAPASRPSPSRSNNRSSAGSTRTRASGGVIGRATQSGGARSRGSRGGSDKPSGGGGGRGGKGR